MLNNMVLAKGLRAAVLQAAIQGKLTEQLPEDGDARDLLAEIKAEKEQLIKEKKIKKEKPLAPIEDEDIPFDIPDNWCWCKLPDIAISSLGKTLNGSKDTGCIKPYLCSINVYWSGYDNKIIKTAKFSETDMQKYLLKRGDVLVCEGGDVGKCIIWDSDEEMYYQNALHRIRFFGNISQKYFWNLMYYYKSNGTIDSVSKGISIKHLVQDSLYSLIFPLPPLAEQLRIVARVEELMAKIDEYEKIENQLEELKEKFPGDMKAALLQAAMQGKLTKQFDTENTETILNSLIINPKLPDVENVPFDIPDNWSWIQIGNLGASLGTESFSDGPFGSNLKQEHQTDRHEVRIIQLSNIGENGWKDKNEKYTTFEHLENVIPRCEVVPGCFVIAKMMPAGRTIEVPELATRITLGSDAMKFMPNAILNKEYLLYAMRSNAFLDQVYADAHGITRVRTTLNAVKSYVLPIPPIEEQQRIVEILDKLLPLCDELN